MLWFIPKISFSFMICNVNRAYAFYLKTPFGNIGYEDWGMSYGAWFEWPDIVKYASSIHDMSSRKKYFI